MKRFTARTGLLAGVAALALAISACSGGSAGSSPGTTGSGGSTAPAGSGSPATAPGGTSSASTGTSSDGDQPKYGGTLRIEDFVAATCISPDGSKAYPDSMISNQLYDRLTYQDPDTAAISPWLATDWTVNSDATVYTFNLRQGVTFSDKTPLNADVVAANFDQLGKGDESLGVPVQVLLTGYDHAEVLGPYRVAIHFSQPNVGFLQATSNYRLGIVSLNTLKMSYNDRCQGKGVAGSGPFVFESSVPDKEVVLARRDDYNWGPPALGHTGKAYLEKLDFTNVPESGVRVGALLAGQADIARGIFPTDESLVTSTPGYHLLIQDVGQSDYLAIKPDHPNLDDIRVRQALIYATDREEFLKTVLSPSYKLASSVLAPNNPGYTDLSSEIVYDPAKANALLDQAGWTMGSDGIRVKNGQRLVISAYPATSQPTAEAMLELFAIQWKKVGIELDIKQADAATYAKVSADPKLNAFTQTTPTRLDPDGLRQSWDGASDVVSHDYPELDKLVEEQNQTTDPAKRKQIAAQAQKWILDNALALPLFNDQMVYGAADYVKGVEHEPQGRAIYVTAWLDK